MNYKVLEKVDYDKPLKGVSMFSGDRVTIIGEEKVQTDEGKILDWYVYHIDHYEAKNGKPFVSIKANIVVG
jgi:hypothetical protein